MLYPELVLHTQISTFTTIQIFSRVSNPECKPKQNVIIPSWTVILVNDNLLEKRQVLLVALMCIFKTSSPIAEPIKVSSSFRGPT